MWKALRIEQYSLVWESYGPSFKLLANMCVMKQKQMRNLLRMRSGKLWRWRGLFLNSPVSHAFQGMKPLTTGRNENHGQNVKIWEHLVWASFPGGSDGKESTCNVGDLGSILGLGRLHGEGKGYPLQYSGRENSMKYRVHVVAKSWTQLSDFHFHISSYLIFILAFIQLIFIPNGHWLIFKVNEQT